MVRFEKETLLVHQTASGVSYEIDVYRYDPPNPTETVYLQGGLHGIELTGIPVLYEFMKLVEEAQFASPDHLCTAVESNGTG